MPSEQQPESPPDLYGDLRDRLRSNDKEGAIELYYQLLSSGRSVGEIINAIGPIASAPDNVDPDTASDQQAPSNRVVTAVSPKLSLASTSEPNLRSTTPTIVARTAERLINDNLDQQQSIRAAFDDPDGSARRNEQVLEHSPSSEIDRAGPAADASDGNAPGIQPIDRASGESRAHPRMAKRIAFGLAGIAAVGLTSIAGVSLLPGSSLVSGFPFVPSVHDAATEVGEHYADPPGKTEEGPAPVPQADSAGAAAMAPGAEALPTSAAAPGEANAHSVAIDPSEPSEASALEAASAVALPVASAVPVAISAALTPVAGTEQAPAPAHPVAIDPAKLAGASRPNPPSATTHAIIWPVGSGVRDSVATAPTPVAPKIKREERRLSQRETEALLMRGDAFFTTGDVTSARLFYEHAATAGNGAAALRLGGTFDPDFLARARFGHMSGDLDKALYWYRRAHELGNGDAEILVRSLETTKR